MVFLVLTVVLSCMRASPRQLTRAINHLFSIWNKQTELYLIDLKASVNGMDLVSSFVNFIEFKKSKNSSFVNKREQSL